MSDFRVGRNNTRVGYFRVDRSHDIFIGNGENFWKAVVQTRALACQHLTQEEIAAHRIPELPTKAAQFFATGSTNNGWEPILKTLFAGTCDENSPFHVLRDYGPDLVRKIYELGGPSWANHVTITIPAAFVGRHTNCLIRFNDGRGRNNGYNRELLEDHTSTSIGPQGFVAFAKCGIVEFPEPKDLNVNMMPFVFGDKSSLPPELHEYFDLIEKCPYMQEDVGKVGYLTVHESFVEAGTSQRRPGVHIESPGVFKDAELDATSFTPAKEHPWGCGVFFGPDLYEG
jgi:hypothetical protein